MTSSTRTLIAREWISMWSKKLGINSTPLKGAIFLGGGGVDFRGTIRGPVLGVGFLGWGPGIFS